MCDGENDCEDRSDETHCMDEDFPKCPSRYFQCISDRRCIEKTWRCDGEQDCSDGSDERYCVSACKRHDLEFECLNNKQCIPMTKRCDGQMDCEDGSDERSCKYFAKECDNLHFPCEENPRCIHREWLCNSINNCDNGSDEKHCNSTTINPTMTEPSCPDNYCMHNGDCVVIDGEYTCNCSSPFTGEKCERGLSAKLEFHVLGMVIGMSLALFIVLF
ncbi:Prolow-density lipoprotein receptor-related like protein [Argiope bruennichi]|uniref:Prolow-density lipoprotein receptor-related like protein n=2 Tax=Argiope bruennichi TaxID=94029 RepID=A0A8T0EC08_ARGBR|nr:Prolow-density lipoprotein receptor-related like protein [Argiope bruennichi]